MIRSFEYRLYPNREQEQALNSTFRACQFLYNSALEEQIAHYKRYGKRLSYNAQCKELKELETFFPEFKVVYSQTARQVLKQLDAAFQGFFRRVKNGETPGHPRFKNKDRFRSICFPQVSKDLQPAQGHGGLKLKNNKLVIFGIPGLVKVKWHRTWEGDVKRAIVKRKSDKFYLYLVCEGVPNKPLPKTNKEVGIDFGLTNFITCDDGTTYQHPKSYRAIQAKLARQQQRLERAQKGSNNQRKRRQALAKTNAYAANVRKDFQHKLANKLIAENDILYIEDLIVEELVKKKDEKNLTAKEKAQETGRRKSIADASWGKFILLLLYKAESAGRIIVKVDPKYTSKMCSSCGQIKKDQVLSDREYECGQCGLKISRDQNAAINIKRLGMSLATSQNVQKPHQAAIHDVNNFDPDTSEIT
jgi:putative transposase